MDEEQTPDEASPTEQLAACLRVCERLFAKWECTDEEQLTLLGGLPSELDPAELSEEQRLRIGCLINIHIYLRMVFSNPDNVYGFIRKKNNNAPFNGREPISMMCESLDGLKESTEAIIGLVKL